MLRLYKFYVTLLSAAGWILCSETSYAVTLHWGGSVGDFVYESDGITKADPANFMFELGTFSDGFDPALEDPSTWAAAWHPIDRGAYSMTTGRLAGSVTLINEPAPDGAILDGNASGADTASFFFGKPAYLWIYNDNTMVGVDTEWNLLHNPDGGGIPSAAWTFPTSAESGVHTEVRDFALSDPGISEIFGAEKLGSFSEGDGAKDQNPTGDWALQTYSMPAAPIPEPRTSLLALMSIGWLLTRRFR